MYPIAPGGENARMPSTASTTSPTASMSRRTAWFLLGVAGWMVFVWGTFIRNLARDEGRPTGFYVAHGVLIVVDLAIAAVIGVIAVRALRATRQPR